MIALNDGIYIDKEDRRYAEVVDTEGWLRLKAIVGRPLSRVIASDHVMVTSDEEYPNYKHLRKEIECALSVT